MPLDPRNVVEQVLKKALLNAELPSIRYNETVQPWEVVTAYFDRTHRGRL